MNPGKAKSNKKGYKPHSLLIKLYYRFLEDQVPALAAQLSYSLVLAFFPFLIFVLTLVGYTPLTGDRILSELASIVPQATYTIVYNIVKDIVTNKSGTLLSFGMLGTLWASSNGLSALVTAFNKAYDHAETRHFLVVKALTLIYTIGLALVIIVIFSLIIFGEIIGKYLFATAGYLVYFKTVWNVARYMISFLSILLVISLLYYILPDKKPAFAEIITGAVFATTGWMVISLGFSYYVNNYTSYTTTYGSIGGVIVLLLWLYWSSVILIMGVELNAILSGKRPGNHRIPYSKRQ